MSLFGSMFNQSQGARRIDGPEAWRLVREENAVLLDVRTPAEFRGGHAEGAVNIPVQELGRRLGEIPAGVPVVVYCASGGRSASASHLLHGAGHQVYDAGGLGNLHC